MSPTHDGNGIASIKTKEISTHDYECRWQRDEGDEQSRRPEVLVCCVREVRRRFLSIREEARSDALPVHNAIYGL